MSKLIFHPKLSNTTIKNACQILFNTRINRHNELLSAQQNSKFYWKSNTTKLGNDCAHRLFFGVLKKVLYR